MLLSVIEIYSPHPHIRSAMRVLVVDDSDRIRESVAAMLRDEGYVVDTACDGKDGLIHLRTTEYDVVVLDVMMPEIDGFEVVRRAREKNVQAAVLLLTARDAVDDRVRGLRSGADDYLVKPFASAELLARVAALVRRRHANVRQIIRIADLEVDTSVRVVRRAGAEMDLTRREFAILEYLALRSPAYVSRHELEEHIYDENARIMSNAIDSAIAALRQKLNAGGRPDLIRTKRGVGYALTEPTDVVHP